MMAGRPLFTVATRHTPQNRSRDVTQRVKCNTETHFEMALSGSVLRMYTYRGRSACNSGCTRARGTKTQNIWWTQAFSRIHSLCPYTRAPHAYGILQEQTEDGDER